MNNRYGVSPKQLSSWRVVAPFLGDALASLLGFAGAIMLMLMCVVWMSLGSATAKQLPNLDDKALVVIAFCVVGVIFAAVGGALWCHTWAFAVRQVRKARIYRKAFSA